jgi:DNA gyrase subunit A
MDIGTVELVDIEKEMRSAYLDYSMSVITSRALPDVRDGLKPVQRRILYTMYDNGLRPDRPYRKSAATVGDVLGKYHPHGDVAVYDAMVRLAQDFSMRYPLVDGQGNFGSIDGDPPAAHRYTEARPTPLAMEMLGDIDMSTVDMRPNYDDSRTEPTVLPARIPNLLLNGASGIAVGMATNIPPHNLGEICDALAYLIDRYDKVEEITPDDLIKIVHGPDFPTGGAIIGMEGIHNAYSTGRGHLTVRGKAHFEELRGGREAIIVTEIPYQLNKSNLVERIAELARTKRIESIGDLRDESDRTGMRIVIELKRGADARTTLNQLLKYSQLQQTFGVNMLALVGGEPRVLPLKRILVHFVDHRREVIRRRSEFELEKARHRQHVLLGLLTALANLDAVIDTIRRSRDASVARDSLMKKFKLSEIQAQAILDMQLRRLAALERQKIEDEHKEVTKRIAYLEGLLADEHKILGVIRDDLAQIKAKYGDKRRTTIVEGEATGLREEDLIAEEDVLITVTDRGYIKRLPASTYRTQRRGGRGIRGATTKADDTVRDNLLANTRDTLLFFTDRGRVFQLPAHQVPDSSRESAGTPLVNLVQTDRDERVTVVLAVPTWQYEHGRYLIMATQRGRIKRTDLKEYEGVRPSGLIGIILEEGDRLRWAKVTSGEDEIIMVTRGGMALRFRESQVRPMGRAAGGVGAIRLKRGDVVATMDVVKPGADLFVVTRFGYGKRTRLSEYKTQGRNTQGIQTIDIRRLGEIGEIADARVVEDGNEITLISDYGIVMRTPTEDLSRMGRATRGVRVMHLDAGHEVASLAYLADREPPQEPLPEPPNPQRRLPAKKREPSSGGEQEAPPPVELEAPPSDEAGPAAPDEPKAQPRQLPFE